MSIVYKQTINVLKIRDVPSGDRPRQKLISLGVDALSLKELLAVILGTGTKKEDVLELTNRILKDYGEITLTNETTPARLVNSLNIPLGKACAIVAANEFGRRIYSRKNGRFEFVNNSDEAFEYFKELGHLKKEHLRGIYLNSRFQVLHEELISIGDLTSNIVHPREVYLPAIEKSASAVILAHNHPSGNTEPSLADLEITDRLVYSGKLLGIQLLDHIIIGDDIYESIINGDD